LISGKQVFLCPIAYLGPESRMIFIAKRQHRDARGLNSTLYRLPKH
jgi:hypothetical protein